VNLRTVPYKWVVASIFVVGLFMDIMDTTIVNVALPTLSREFGASGGAVEWVVLGYLLSLAVWIPASGWIGDRFGTKKTFLFALAAFTLASALCGQAHSLGELIAFRVLQGVGGGMLTPVGTAMLFRAFPPVERAKASTILMIPTVLAPALGPIVGGWLVTDVSWRWIFYVNLPLGVLGFLIGLFLLKEHREPTAGRFDVPGFVLSGAGLALVLFALSRAPEIGWLTVQVIGTGLTGILLFALLVYVELRVPHPMLALRLYKERMFRNANIILTFSYGGFAGVLFLMPLFLQELRGLSALQSGLTTFPQAVGVMISSQVVGRIYHRVGPRRLIFAGLIAVAVASVALVFVDLSTNLWWIRGILFVRGMAMAASFVPLQAATYANISPSDTGRASAIYSTQRQVAAALGVAILATVWISRTKALTAGAANTAAVTAAKLGGYHDAFLVGAIIAVIGALSALLIRDTDAASTMRPRQPKRDERAESDVVLASG
jgi:EmrB/QacA subfamily drug resistance transporter